MIILTCKSCGQTFQAKGLKNDITSIPCPKCWETIDIQTSIRSIQKKPKSESTHSFIPELSICLLWSFLAFAVFAYVHYQFDLKKTFKHTDELVNCAIAAIQSVDVEKKPVVHLVDVPIKIAENAEKAKELIVEDELPAVETTDEDDVVISYRDLVLNGTFQNIVDNSLITYISLRNYTNSEVIEKFKNDATYSVSRDVPLSNSDFTKVASVTFHKKYDLSKGEYIYLQLTYVFDVRMYLALFGFFALSTVFIYCIAVLSFKTFHKQPKQTEESYKAQKSIN